MIIIIIINYYYYLFLELLSFFRIQFCGAPLSIHMEIAL